MALISLRMFGGMRNPPVRGRRRGRATKNPARHAARASWRSFGEYALLKDSRYMSQAENRFAIKSLDSHGIAAAILPSAASLSARTSRDIVSRTGRFVAAKAKGGQDDDTFLSASAMVCRGVRQRSR